MCDLSYHFVTDDFTPVRADDTESVRREASTLCEKKGVFICRAFLPFLKVYGLMK